MARDNRALKIAQWGILPALILILALVAFLGGTNACKFASAMEPARDHYGSWCFEFWLNRYQGFLGALATLGGGYFAYQAVLRQTRAAREGVLIAGLAALRHLTVDVQETRGYAFAVANIRSLALRVEHASSLELLDTLNSEYIERWREHRQRVSSIIHAFFGFVPSARLAKALSEWSVAANRVDNFGFHWTQTIAVMNGFPTLDERKSYLSEKIAARMQAGEERGGNLEQLRERLLEALGRQIQLLETELVRIAPPPE